MARACIRGPTIYKYVCVFVRVYIYISGSPLRFSLHSGSKWRGHVYEARRCVCVCVCKRMYIYIYIGFTFEFTLHSGSKWRGHIYETRRGAYLHCRIPQRRRRRAHCPLAVSGEGAWAQRCHAAAGLSRFRKGVILF